MQGTSSSTFVVVGSRIPNNNNAGPPVAIYNTAAPQNIPAYLSNPSITTVAQEALNLNNYAQLLDASKLNICKELSALRLNELSLKQCKDTVAKIQAILPTLQSFASIPDYNYMHLAMSARLDMMKLHRLITGVHQREKALQEHYQRLDCSVKGYLNAGFTAMIDGMLEKNTADKLIIDNALSVLKNVIKRSPYDAVQEEENAKIMNLIRGMVLHRRACLAAKKPH